MGFLSKLFGKQDDPLDDALNKIRRIIEDESYQNSLYPEGISDSILNGDNCDQINGASGEFGHTITNPIPVNGSIGELAYLSSLVTDNDERLLFHRLGSINTLDVFEAVTLSGSEWHIFYVDLYHPRKSRIVPQGFHFGDGLRQFSGFQRYCPDFPYDFPEQKIEEQKSGLSMAYIALSHVTDPISKRVFQRTDEHNNKLSTVRGLLSGRST